ncbi:MAG: FAD-dependent oxidoreductase, partial [Albidovulum sp.]
AEMLEGFDEVIVATGVRPRDPRIPGQDAPHVLGYVDVLNGAPVGDRVVIVGAGGIGFDVAEFLTQAGESPTLHLDHWLAEWGVTDPDLARGGLVEPRPQRPARAVTLLQRKPEKPGRKLGRTTGWIHRAALQARGVEMIGGVSYEGVEPEGLRISFGPERESPRLIPADTIVLCAGQESERTLAEALAARGCVVHVIGGADVAAELDAKRAIDQGTRLAARL